MVLGDQPMATLAKVGSGMLAALVKTFCTRSCSYEDLTAKAAAAAVTQRPTAERPSAMAMAI